MILVNSRYFAVWRVLLRRFSIPTTQNGHGADAAAHREYPVKRFVYVIANITALSGLLFGYDIGKGEGRKERGGEGYRQSRSGRQVKARSSTAFVSQGTPLPPHVHALTLPIQGAREAPSKWRASDGSSGGRHWATSPIRPGWPTSKVRESKGYKGYRERERREGRLARVVGL
jgi:hypothetical protein